MKKLFKNIVLPLLSAILAAAAFSGLTFFSDEITDAVKNSVMRCMNVMIPSLFAVTALSTLLVDTGLCRLAAKPFHPIAKYIFRLPDELFIIVLLSNVSGYPIGIKLLSELYKKGSITKRTAELLSCCCYCGGPAFYASAIGLALFGDIKSGAVVFLSVSCSDIVAAAAIGHIFKPKVIGKNKKLKFNADILNSSVLSAGRAMFVICTFIVAFSIPCAVIDALGITHRICTFFGADTNSEVLLRSCLEISNISDIKGVPYGLLPAISAVCSFGGICIILQLCALRHKDISLVPFLLSRIPIAALSFAACKLISRSIFPKALPAFSEQKHIFVIMNNFVPSFCLIMMILILNFKKTLAFSKRV